MYIYLLVFVCILIQPFYVHLFTSFCINELSASNPCEHTLMHISGICVNTFVIHMHFTCITMNALLATRVDTTTLTMFASNDFEVALLINDSNFSPITSVSFFYGYNNYSYQFRHCIWNRQHHHLQIHQFPLVILCIHAKYTNIDWQLHLQS